MNTILFLSAEPADAPRLRLGEEARGIREMLQSGKIRSLFKLEERFSVRGQDFAGAMLVTRPRIVHFSGHGTGTGKIALEDKAGGTANANLRALALVFKQFPGEISCVILNSCFSARQAELITPYAGYVISMTRPISDKAAIAFSTGFYQALAERRAVPAAFELGCAQIGLQGLREQSTPKLTKGTELPPLDIRPVSHLPIVLALGCSDEEFRGMVTDALYAMNKYGSEGNVEGPKYRQSLDRDDFSIYQPGLLRSDEGAWTE